jgi:pyruvate dehydrogenase E2 component (dihydrolipoamide acetyltransferase)
MTEITMPSLSDSMEEGTILSWLKQPGERVARGDELVEIETDKATMTYESPAEGALEIVAGVGTSLPVGAVIARVGDVAEPPPAEMPAPEQPAEPVTQPTADPQPPAAARVARSGDGIRATPLAQRVAAAHGVDLAKVTGSGPRGQVLRADVQRAAGIATQPLLAPAMPSRPMPPPDEVAGTRGEVTIIEPSRLQQAIARRMAEARAVVPEFQVQTEVAVDRALALRAQLKQLHGATAPSVNDLIIKASALALRRHPRANGSYREGRFALYSRVNVGIAVAAQDALVVPVLLDADARSLGDIASESRRLAGRVRSGEITPPELSGATFTVSNLGMYGMTAITPVLTPPQAGILGVGAARTVPAVEDGGLVERQLMTLTLTCDHRILYGADAAAFLSTIRELLEQPLALAM